MTTTCSQYAKIYLCAAALLPAALTVPGPLAARASVLPFERAVTDDEVEQPITYDQVRLSIKAACGRCHQGGVHRGGVRLDTESQVVWDAAVILEAVASGSMPYNDPAWNTTGEGQRVMAYLRQQLGT